MITFELCGENDYQTSFSLKKCYDIFALYLWTILFKQLYFPSSFENVALCSVQFCSANTQIQLGVKMITPIKIAKFSQNNSLFMLKVIYHILYRAFSNQNFKKMFLLKTTTLFPSGSIKFLKNNLRFLLTLLWCPNIELNIEWGGLHCP